MKKTLIISNSLKAILLTGFLCLLDILNVSATVTSQEGKAKHIEYANNGNTLRWRCGAGNQCYIFESVEGCLTLFNNVVPIDEGCGWEMPHISGSGFDDEPYTEYESDGGGIAYNRNQTAVDFASTKSICTPKTNTPPSDWNFTVFN